MTPKASLYIIHLLFGIFMLGIVGCAEEPKKEEPEMIAPEEEVVELDTNQFLLDDHGIKIELPDGFEKYSAVEYQNKLKSLYKNRRLDYELSRLRQLRDMDGTLYIFFNESTNSAFTINAAPLMEMDSNSAKDLLEMVRSNHEEASKASNHQYEKVSAKYSDRSENQIFKAVYKITGKEMEEPVYAHSYIISHENITLYISGTSVGEFDYDPYIETITF